MKSTLRFISFADLEACREGGARHAQAIAAGEIMVQFRNLLGFELDGISKDEAFTILTKLDCQVLFSFVGTTRPRCAQEPTVF